MEYVRKILFLGDVHIGTNAATNWYQKSLHEPYLLAFFDYVCENADAIQELVILGDLVDQWNYLPDERPPRFRQIAAENPRIFGGVVEGQRVPGALAEALTALDGRVTYVRGSHDMSVRFEELARVQDRRGRTLRIAPGPLYLPADMLGHLVCTHGHIFSFFHAPDYANMPSTGIPLGHFLTRLAALDASRKLAGKDSVGEMTGSGDPSDWSISVDALVGLATQPTAGSCNLVELAMGTLLEAVGETEALKFHLMDGGVISAGEVVRRYARLWESWENVARHPQQIFGSDPGLMALSSTDGYRSLGHFARILGGRYKAIVMGHTHAENETGKLVSLVDRSLYANIGFMCPTRPSLSRVRNPQLPTFVEVTRSLDGKTYEAQARFVMHDQDGYRVAREPLCLVRRVSERRMSEASMA